MQLTELQEEGGAAGAPGADPGDGQVQRGLVVQLADLYLPLLLNVFAIRTWLAWTNKSTIN